MQKSPTKVQSAKAKTERGYDGSAGPCDWMRVSSRRDARRLAAEKRRWRRADRRAGRVAIDEAADERHSEMLEVARIFQALAEACAWWRWEAEAEYQTDRTMWRMGA